MIATCQLVEAPVFWRETVFAGMVFQKIKLK